MASNAQNLLNMFMSFAGQNTQQSGATGNANLASATSFFKKIMGGGADARQAAAPGINEITAQADAARAEQGKKGTARTGGTAAANRQQQDTVRGQIADMIMKAQTEAAGEVAGIGQGELDNMLSTLGIGTNAAQKEVDSARQAKMALWSSLIGGAGDVVGAYLSKPS